MSSEEVKAAKRLAPYGEGGSADTNVLLFTATTTSQAHALPDSWSGAFITVRAVGGTVYWYVSKNSAATCDETKTAGGADGDPDPARGKIAGDGVDIDYQLPIWDPSTENMYFVRAAGSNLTIEVTKSSF